VKIIGNLFNECAWWRLDMFQGVCHMVTKGPDSGVYESGKNVQKIWHVISNGLSASLGDGGSSSIQGRFIGRP
jgi:hypothetical protein